MFSYDEVPYHSSPFAQSHPDRLAVIATLFGMQPQPIDRCRVLELGCASGGNIIPMAEMFPESLFLGIDLSERQLAEGHAVIEQLALNNIELLHCDIRDVNLDLGTFHYIIAHGVYSWVPPKVQQKILQICRDQLTPNGVAYISYNTYPGWRMRGMIRDMLVYHTRQFEQPQERVDQAKALLKFLAGSTDQKSSYGSYLKEELELFGQVSDAYLYHDHLEEDNEPIYFHEFVKHAELHGLQFLGEADFHMMAYWQFAPEISDTLQRLSHDLIQVEQYMDFLRNRTFRQTLLCHRQQPLIRSLDGSQLDSLWIASPLQKQSPETNDEDTLSLQYSNITVSSREPLIKAAHLLLTDSWPQAIAFEDLLVSALRQCSGLADQGKAEARLREHLIRCYAARAIELHSSYSHFTTNSSDFPTVSVLARLQAQTGSIVTNRKHESVSLDVVGWQIVRCLDGRHDFEGIERFVWERVEQGDLNIKNENGEAVPVAQAQELIADICQRSLMQFRNLALLIG